jgi:hypothetical protein
MRTAIAEFIKENNEADLKLSHKFKIMLMLSIIVFILNLWFIADMLGM